MSICGSAYIKTPNFRGLNQKLFKGGTPGGERKLDEGEHTVCTSAFANVQGFSLFQLFFK